MKETIGKKVSENWEAKKNQLVKWKNCGRRTFENRIVFHFPGSCVSGGKKRRKIDTRTLHTHMQRVCNKNVNCRIRNFAIPFWPALESRICSFSLFTSFFFLLPPFAKSSASFSLWTSATAFYFGENGFIKYILRYISPLWFVFFFKKFFVAGLLTYASFLWILYETLPSECRRICDSAGCIFLQQQFANPPLLFFSMFWQIDLQRVCCFQTGDEN